MKATAMRKTIFILLGITLTSIGFYGCKKGKGDPFLSLHSRKARVVGEWTVSAGKGSSADIKVAGTMTTNQSSTWSYDGSTLTQTTITTINGGSSSTATTTRKSTTKYTFVKDGTFKTEDTDNSTSPATVQTTEGVWNFTGKVGDYKGRSQIFLKITKITSGGTVTNYDGTDAPSVLYDIYELKNKEMIFKTSDKKASGSNSYTDESEWTLTQ
jgi:hypothetical protein